MFIYPYFANFPELVLSRLEYPDYFVVESGDDTFRSIAESAGIGERTVSAAVNCQNVT